MGGSKRPGPAPRPIRVKRCVRHLKVKGPVPAATMDRLLALGFGVEVV